MKSKKNIKFSFCYKSGMPYFVLDYGLFFRYNLCCIFVNTCNENIIIESEVFLIWRWHSSLRRDQDLRFMASVQEWVLPEEGKYFLQEEEKEEKFYLHKGRLNGLLVIRDEIFRIIKKEWGFPEGIWQKKIFCQQIFYNVYPW